jgi:hypothetical protein
LVFCFFILCETPGSGVSTGGAFWWGDGFILLAGHGAAFEVNQRVWVPIPFLIQKHDLSQIKAWVLKVPRLMI